jgi:hypothetical protein
MKHKYTHRGLVVKASGEKITNDLDLLRETKNFWVLMGGRKFRKATGTETGEHPMFRLHLWSIKPNAPAELPAVAGMVRRDVGLIKTKG